MSRPRSPQRETHLDAFGMGSLESIVLGLGAQVKYRVGYRWLYDRSRGYSSARTFGQGALALSDGPGLDIVWPMAWSLVRSVRRSKAGLGMDRIESLAASYKAETGANDP